MTQHPQVAPFAKSAGHTEGIDANRTAMREHAAADDGGTFVFNIWVRGPQAVVDLNVWMGRKTERTPGPAVSVRP